MVDSIFFAAVVAAAAAAAEEEEWRARGGVDVLDSDGAGRGGGRGGCGRGGGVGGRVGYGGTCSCWALLLN